MLYTHDEELSDMSLLVARCIILGSRMKLYGVEKLVRGW